MIGTKANSGYRRALLGVAGAVFTLALLADGAMVSANGQQASAGAGLVQAIQISTQKAYAGSARFVGNMQTLYHLGQMEKLVPPASATAAPHKVEEHGVFTCSETQPVKTEVKSRI